MENHSFSVELAILLTQEGATLLQHHYFWHKRNKSNNKNFIDGYHWTYNSASAFSEIFPYLSEKQIRSLHENFIACGFMVKGNYNKNKCDRSQWFALTEFGVSIFENWNLPKVYSMLQNVKWIFQNVKSKSKKVKSIYLEVTPIPDVKPNVNTDVNSDSKESVVTDTPPLQTNLSEIPTGSNFSTSEKPNNSKNETSALKEKSKAEKTNSGGGGENVGKSVSEVDKPAKPKKAVREWFKLSSLTEEQKDKIRELARSFDSPAVFGESLRQWLEYKEAGEINFRNQKINPYKNFETMLKEVTSEVNKCKGQSEVFKQAVQHSIDKLYLGLFPEKFITQTQTVKNGNYNKQQQGNVQPTIIFKTGC